MSEESPKRNTLSNHANEAWGFPMVKHISYVCWIFAHKSYMYKDNSTLYDNTGIHYRLLALYYKENEQYSKT